MSSDFADWRTYRLDELATIKRGASPRPIQDPRWFATAGHGWVRISDVTRSDRVLRQTTQYLSDEGRAASVEIGPGDLIMSICATIGRPLFSGIHACIHDGFVAFKNIRLDLIDPDYLYHFLKMSEPHFDSLSQPGTQKNLNSKLVGGTEINLPPLSEQKRIAEALRSVDELLSLVERQAAQGERALSAYSTEAFADAAPLDGTGMALEDLLSRIIDYRGVPPPKAPSGVPLLTAKNVRFGYLDIEPREFIAEEDYVAWMRRGIPAAGDVMFTTEAPLGNVANFPDYRAALGQRTLTLRPAPTRLTSSYLKWLLLSPNAQALIERHATGSTAKGIKQKTFRKLRFNVPPLTSQREIGAACDAIWAGVIASRAQRHALAKLRNFVSKDLLSGRVRVPE